MGRKKLRAKRKNPGKKVDPKPKPGPVVPVPKKKLVVRSREDYPLAGFDDNLEFIFLQTIKLKVIDRRLSDLENLAVLDLADNEITSVEPLRNLKGGLEKLVLDRNPITSIDEDLFISPGLASLTHLSLNNIGLTTVPRSILKLKKLRMLCMASNKLKQIPYNIGNMANLTNLYMNKNQLFCLPFTIFRLELDFLNLADNEFSIHFVRNKWADRETRFNGTMKGVPPLMVLSAEALANHQHFKRSYYSATTSANARESLRLNKDCIELLEALHICSICDRLCFNFAVCHESTYSRPADHIRRDIIRTIIHSAVRFDVLRVKCARCYERAQQQQEQRRQVYD